MRAMQWRLDRAAIRGWKIDARRTTAIVVGANAEQLICLGGNKIGYCVTAIRRHSINFPND